MSSITDMVVFTGIDESEAMARLNAWCAENGEGQQFCQLDTGGAGGRKVFCSPVWAMAGNYFPHDQLAAVFSSFGWRWPQGVVLLLDYAHDDDVRVVRAAPERDSPLWPAEEIAAATAQLDALTRVGVADVPGIQARLSAVRMMREPDAPAERLVVRLAWELARDVQSLLAEVLAGRLEESLSEMPPRPGLEQLRAVGAISAAVVQAYEAGAGAFTGTDDMLGQLSAAAARAADKVYGQGGANAVSMPDAWRSGVVVSLPAGTATVRFGDGGEWEARAADGTVLG